MIDLKNIDSKIKTLLNSKNYDVRVSNNGRFTDQKCTPDILNAVSDSILHFCEAAKKNDFTIRDIWSSNYANDVMTKLFHKPDVSNPGAANEYDKVFSQPIKLLEYSGVISVLDSGRPVRYGIKNEEVLQYIALSDRKSLDFLTKYLIKVLSDSGVYNYFDDFFRNPNKQSFSILKDAFIKFMIENTPINHETESSRIFAKILNPLAYSNNTYGTASGRISAGPISYTELFYNRINFRDREKPKDVSRQDFALELDQTSGSAELYQVDKAKRNVKAYHNSINEVNRFDTNPADHVHHIFPRSWFPELSDTFENLIVINPTQHLSFAHPSGNTNKISMSYQLVCLLAKIVSVQQSALASDGFYSLKNFVNVVNTGLDQQLIDELMPIELMQHKISEYYVQDSYNR